MKRIWHHWQKWECVSAGMYRTVPPDGYTSESAVEAYMAFLADLPRFEAALRRLLNEWIISCEQFLLNEGINRIAWLGQASMCIETGVPACFRAGFSRLSLSKQKAANGMADKYRLIWEAGHAAREAKILRFTLRGRKPETPTGLHARIEHYISTWQKRGYFEELPDEVPLGLAHLNLAPSYKAIAIAILKNDHALCSLGYTNPVSPWYNVLKKIEIEARDS